MLRYVTNLLYLFVCFTAFSQTENTATTETETRTVSDSIAFKKTYGLRIGIDAASLARTGFDKNYTGFQAIVDYRIDSRWYAAGEIGTEQIAQFNERVDARSAGSFLKLGADYNFYQNWLDMDNMVYAGLRVGYATFNQDITRYDYYQDNTYFPIPTNEVSQEFSGLNAFWLELQVGIKVEVLKNLYLGFNLQVKRSVFQDQPDTFTNLHIPGFGRTNDLGALGVGYGYGISYRIPLYKK